MRRNSRRFAVSLVAILACGLPLAVAGKPSEQTAKIHVEGLGFLRARELRAALQRVLATETHTTVDSNAIEDGAVILASSLVEEGFQQARIEIHARLADGAMQDFVFDPTFANALPRPLAATEVTFKVVPGIRSHIDTVVFSGLTVIPLRKARAFFRSDATLISTAQTNAFSPSRINRAAEGLQGELRQRGYAESEVRTQTLADEATGKVRVQVEVKEGPFWNIADLKYQREAEDAVKLPPIEGWLSRAWSVTLQEDIREAIRQAYYAEGFPDIGVHVVAEPRETTEGKKSVDVVATIVPGSHVTVGQVRFEGNVTTKEKVLRRRVLLAPGDPLNLIAIERARYRISRLGVFEAVNIQYQPEEGTVRDPLFVVREGPRYETSLLAGYGSYEQFRVGIEHRQMNIFGLAHQSRLELVQSMKSTSGDYTYTVPELFGESLDGTAKLFGLQRREIAFRRQEYGVDLSLKRSVRALSGEATVGYTFQALRNRDSELSTEAIDDEQVNVASVNVGLTSDRRDNRLRPRHGYHWSSQAELADPKLGGEATYQRFELSGAYHTGWGSGRLIHIGLSHGVITTLGGDDDTSLPVNKRFFPGGDNSIRGYQRGEAAPRDSAGRFIGAKSYVLGNLEIEQPLTPNWSIVAFGDALGTAVSLRGYPFNERLYSVGLGIRYQTLIGPIRLEYGRNINPRPDDPPGTWQISIGYPF